ncbi:hypothetical protein GPECTOR_28g733 [Gonium pectorale]|uniref:Endoglucanase n=1 Tax=Gonium pectorale TaxID=33097 RepID=A0A150GEP6_GONPE|nr:hypothetical protein GPECTOR_28g733 [Gonium pectorale]|eukprot:KXZ48327.1 hypothetical protein GPECTOR_28g733 [Gonium pectorale]
MAASQEALDGSYFFYEAQQAGPLPTWNRAARWNGGWRDASFLNDGSDIDRNLTGGWFDAGDHMKFQLPFGWSASTLAWSVVEFPAAYGPPSGSLFQTARRNLLFAADYIVRSHVNASDVPGENVYAAQIGDTDTDHTGWCRPEQCPEIQGPYRPTWVADRTRPGADIVGEAVASLVGVASVLKMENPADPAIPLLMTHARQLYAFAKAFPGTWDVPVGDYPYKWGSNQSVDDMLWAAAWMCRAGEGASYCADALDLWYGADDGIAWSTGMDYDNVFNQATAMMLGMADRFEPWFLDELRARLIHNLDRWHVSVNCLSPPDATYDKDGDGVVDDYKICYTSKGLAMEVSWGALRVTASAAALKLVLSKHTADDASETQRQRCWARKQMRLMLGDWGRSFVVGFGHNPPARPHHASSTCDPDFNIPCDTATYADPRPNPSVLRGALVGGPFKNDTFLDSRQNWETNEPALDYNAGYTVALAGLIQSQCTDLTTDYTALQSCSSCVIDPVMQAFGTWRCSVCLGSQVLASGQQAVDACMTCVREGGADPYMCALQASGGGGAGDPECDWCPVNMRRALRGISSSRRRR